MYAIKFTKGFRVRDATETRGNPEYNAIDSAFVEGAKTWKTKRGADNYLKFKVLVGRQGERVRTRWNLIEIVEVFREPPRFESVKPSIELPASIMFEPDGEVARWLERQK